MIETYGDDLVIQANGLVALPRADREWGTRDRRQFLFRVTQEEDGTVKVHFMDRQKRDHMPRETSGGERIPTQEFFQSCEASFDLKDVLVLIAEYLSCEVGDLL